MRRRHRRLQGNPDLDITAFMNLMIVLVPVLLLGMVFSQIHWINLDFPGMAPGETPDPAQLQLVVTVRAQGLTVADSERGTIRALPASDLGQDYRALREVLKAIKARVPDKTSVILQVAGDVDYQTLVSVMDTVRSYPAVVAASEVEAELFPDVSLARVPVVKETSAVPGEHDS